MRWKIDKGPCELNLRRKGPCVPTFSPPSGRKRTMCAHLQPTFREKRSMWSLPSGRERTIWSLPSGRKGPCGAYLQEEKDHVEPTFREEKCG